MKYIVSFSGVGGSALDSIYSSKNLWAENTIILFADTLIESPDFI